MLAPLLSKSKQLKKLGLNERQVKAMLFLKQNKKITSKDYQPLSDDISDRTALRDIEQLIGKNLIVKVGQKKGLITYYQSLLSQIQMSNKCLKNVGYVGYLSINTAYFERHLQPTLPEMNLPHHYIVSQLT